MEDTLAVLKQGKPAHVAYDTTFIVQWPEHLGGQVTTIDFTGAMTCVPILGVD